MPEYSIGREYPLEAETLAGIIRYEYLEAQRLPPEGAASMAAAYANDRGMDKKLALRVIADTIGRWAA